MSNIVIILTVRKANTRKTLQSRPDGEKAGNTSYITRMLISVSLAYLLTSIPYRLIPMVLITYATDQKCLISLTSRMIWFCIMQYHDARSCRVRYGFWITRCISILIVWVAGKDTGKILITWSVGVSCSSLDNHSIVTNPRPTPAGPVIGDSGPRGPVYGTNILLSWYPGPTSWAKMHGASFLGQTTIRTRQILPGFYPSVHIN
jgi:hypothetical protein